MSVSDGMILTNMDPVYWLELLHGILQVYHRTRIQVRLLTVGRAKLLIISYLCLHIGKRVPYPPVKYINVRHVFYLPSEKSLDLWEVLLFDALSVKICYAQIVRADGEAVRIKVEGRLSAADVMNRMFWGFFKVEVLVGKSFWNI